MGTVQHQHGKGDSRGTNKRSPASGKSLIRQNLPQIIWSSRSSSGPCPCGERFIPPTDVPPTDVQAKTQADLMTVRIKMGQEQGCGRLRQLELQKTLSVAMQNEGTSYRTLCFTLYGRVSSCRGVELKETCLGSAGECHNQSSMSFLQILTPLQMAKVIVHSFPYFPNARALMHSILGVSPPQILMS